VTLPTYCFTSIEVMSTDPMLSIVRVKTPLVVPGSPVLEIEEVTLIAATELAVAVVLVESEAAVANGSNDTVTSMAKNSNAIAIFVLSNARSLRFSPPPQRGWIFLFLAIFISPELLSSCVCLTCHIL